VSNVPIPRPPAIFDRETEWAELEAFIHAPRTPRLGLVYGRRRQGKSFLLQGLTEATGGLYHQALEEDRTPALARVARAVADFLGLPAWSAAQFEDWPAAVRAMADAAGDRPIVIDEVPYLLRESPELPSAIQAAYDAAIAGRDPSFRLLLCGSSLSVMTQLLTGQQALRGRAALDMPIWSFDFREARRFWEVDDLETAFHVHAVLGGPPGYRDLLSGAMPGSMAEFEEWLSASVLNPSHALFREAEYLLTENPTLVDRALYRSIISTIAAGEATRHGIATRLRRSDSAVDYPIMQLERSQFVIRDEDLLRTGRPLLRVADPLLRFHFAILRPELARFEARQTRGAWQASQDRFVSHVVGPHFEGLARAWTATYASATTLGGSARQVGFAQVNDRYERRSFELDVVAAAEPRAGRPALLAIGEAKGGATSRSSGDLARLERLRELLAARADVRETKLLLFGRSGFTPELEDVASKRDDVELIDLQRLYEGT
jgi:hypothetical protein